MDNKDFVIPFSGFSPALSKTNKNRKRYDLSGMIACIKGRLKNYKYLECRRVDSTCSMQASEQISERTSEGSSKEESKQASKLASKQAS